MELVRVLLKFFKESRMPENNSSKKIMARGHCPKCLHRAICEVQIIGPKKQGQRTKTPCLECKKQEIISALVFDQEY